MSKNFLIKTSAFISRAKYRNRTANLSHFVRAALPLSYLTVLIIIEFTGGG